MPKYHSKDLRKGRFSEANRIYHITTTTYDRRPWFKDFKNGRMLVERLQNEQARADTLAYVVMPDHLHWLMQLKAGTQLAKVVQNIKKISASKINQSLGRTGKIWQSGYYDHALRKEEDIQSIARYIVANPLRAGLVTEIGQYPLWDAKWL